MSWKKVVQFHEIFFPGKTFGYFPFIINDNSNDGRKDFFFVPIFGTIFRRKLLKTLVIVDRALIHPTPCPILSVSQLGDSFDIAQIVGWKKELKSREFAHPILLLQNVDPDKKLEKWK